MKKLVLYHNYLFILGFIYYLVFPAFFIANGFWSDYPGMHYLYKYYDNSLLAKYCIIIISYLLLFIAGSYAPLKFAKQCKTRRYNSSHISERDLFLLSIPLFVLCNYFIFKSRSILFQGYAVDYDVTLMGTVATCNLFFLFFYLYIRMNMMESSKKNIYNSFFLYSCLWFSIVLLGLGSRMYIMIPLVAFIIYLIDNKIVSIKKVVYVGLVVVLFFLSIGVWRIGGNIADLESLLYIGFGEPLFTWISIVSMFSYTSELPLLAFPFNYLSSFVNFVPSIIFPLKGEFVSEISLPFDAPLGATNLLVSVISNFGLLGGGVFLFILGFSFTYIRYNFRGHFGLTYYYCLCGIIPFQLFRDAFPIVNKMIFINFFILPMAIFFIQNKLVKSSRSSV